MTRLKPLSPLLLLAYCLLLLICSVRASSAAAGAAIASSSSSSSSSARASRGVNDVRNPVYERLPSLREQAGLKDGWTRERVEGVGRLLRKYGVDAWIISQKEYAEDTVFWSLKPATAFSARRRTTILFLANATQGPSSYTWIDNTEKLWRDLKDVVRKEGLETIAVNADAQVAFSSGIHAGELALLQAETGLKWGKNLVSIPMLAVEFVATMPKAQLDWYRKLQSTAWAMIKDGFSEKVIEPGVTTTADVEWWLRSQIQAWNYTTWFMPSVSILPLPEGEFSFSSEDRAWEAMSKPSLSDNVINHGDLLHVDFGVTALGMNTDTQHLAYVLHPGEKPSNISKSLKEGLKKANRLQDILRSEMKVGISGNEILKNALHTASKEGVTGSIYSHPIGDWGHSAGTLIGMTNLQTGVPILGDLPLLKNTYYSIELYAEHFVPERNRTMKFYLEEDVYWDEGKESWEWVHGRQDEFWVIKSDKEGVKGDAREDERFLVQEL